jgi:hypothetical protein
VVREQGCAAGDVAEGRQAEVDGGGPAGPLVELGEFLLRAGEADLEALDLAEPAFVLGIGDAGQRLSRISVIRRRWVGSVDEGCTAGSCARGLPGIPPTAGSAKSKDSKSAETPLGKNSPPSTAPANGRAPDPSNSECRSWQTRKTGAAQANTTPAT